MRKLSLRIVKEIGEPGVIPTGGSSVQAFEIIPNISGDGFIKPVVTTFPAPDGSNALKVSWTNPNDQDGGAEIIFQDAHEPTLVMKKPCEVQEASVYRRYRRNFANPSIWRHVDLGSERLNLSDGSSDEMRDYFWDSERKIFRKLESILF